MVGKAAAMVGGATLAYILNKTNRPKKMKLPEIEGYKPPTNFLQDFMQNPNLGFVKPFKSMSEQFLFRKQQEDLLNLKLYQPREKLGE